MTSTVRIGVYLADQNPDRDRSRGITVMTESLLSRLETRADVTITSLSSRSSFSWERSGTRTRIPWRTDEMAGRLAVDALHPFWQRRRDVDVWWYPKGYGPSLGRPPRRTVGLVADAIIAHYAEHHPATRSTADLTYWIRQLGRALRVHDRVCTLSMNSRAQLLDFCDRHRIDLPDISVVGCGSEWELHRRAPMPVLARKDQVVHLAAEAPHKRTNELLHAWTTLAAAGRDLPRLVLVGSLDGEGERLVAGHSTIERSGFLNVEQMQALFAESLAVLIPSEIEGFGLPALEAAYVGTPVLFRPDTAVAEVVGPLGAWGEYRPADADSLWDALQRAQGASTDVLATWGADLASRFALDRVTDRLLAELRAASG